MARRKTSQPPVDLSYIAEDLRPLAVSIDDLTPDPANPNSHDERSIDVIAASIREHGQRKPLVVNRRTKIIESGNGTHAAAKRCGWTHVAVLWVDDDAVQAARWAIADNRTAEFSEWDVDHFSALRTGLEAEGQWDDLDALMALSEICPAAEESAGDDDGPPPEPPAPIHFVQVKFANLDDAEKLFRRLHKQKFEVTIKTP